MEMTDNEKAVLREMKKLWGRANAEMLVKRLPFSITYIQHLLSSLHEARHLKVDTLARYPMYYVATMKRRLKL